MEGLQINAWNRKKVGKDKRQPFLTLLSEPHHHRIQAIIEVSNAWEQLGSLSVQDTYSLHHLTT